MEQEPKWLLSGEFEFGCLVGVLFRGQESLSQAVKEGGLMSIRTMRPRRGVGSSAHNFGDFVLCSLRPCCPLLFAQRALCLQL